MECCLSLILPLSFAKCGWSLQWCAQQLQFYIIPRAFSVSHRLPLLSCAWCSPMWGKDWWRLRCIQACIHWTDLFIHHSSAWKKYLLSQVYDSWRFLYVYDPLHDHFVDKPHFSDMFLNDTWLIFIQNWTLKETSLLSCINHATIAPNICCCACVTNNFVSLGVAGSRKYVIRLVMFGGLVSFSYCPCFVLITVVWIGSHPYTSCPSSPLHKWH